MNELKIREVVQAFMHKDLIGRIEDFFVRHKLYFFLVCIILLFFRRPMEFIHPYVWVEDGTWNIPHYLNLGISLFFEPVQGYLVLPPKIINFISLKLSFAYYPEISMALSVLFSLFCLGAIAYSPTGLKYKTLCAIAVLLIPTDPEVFVVPQYSFWWGTLLIVISLLWAQGKTYSKRRLFFTLIGGLSSPIVILLLPLFAIRTYFYRTKEDVTYTFIVLILSIIQGYYVIQYAQTTPIGILDILIHIPDILNKYIGQYFFKHTPTILGVVIALTILSFLTFVSIQHRDKLTSHFFLLILLFALCILSSIKRNPIEIIDPYNAGPRYFFFPYIVFSWILLWLIFFTKESKKSIHYLLIFIFSISIINAALKFPRYGDYPKWREQISLCLNNEIYNIAINTDGRLQNIWFLTLSGADCKKLLDQSLFDNHWKEKNSVKYKNVFLEFHDTSPENMALPKLDVLSGSWQYGQFPIEINADESLFLSSWIGSDMATGMHRLKFTASSVQSTISYMTGPIALRQMITIMESDTLKPILHVSLEKSEKIGFLSFATEEGKSYEIQLSDNGNEWGEWSAIKVTY